MGFTSQARTAFKAYAGVKFLLPWERLGDARTEYKIFLKDLEGELLRVIEVPHKHIKLSREGRRRLLAEFKGGNLETLEAALSAELIALEEIKSLPRAWLRQCLGS